MPFLFISYAAPTMYPNKGSTFPYLFHSYRKPERGVELKLYTRKGTVESNQSGRVPYAITQHPPTHRWAGSAQSSSDRPADEPDPGRMVLGKHILETPTNIHKHGM